MVPTLVSPKLPLPWIWWASEAGWEVLDKEVKGQIKVLDTVGQTVQYNVHEYTMYMYIVHACLYHVGRESSLPSRSQVGWWRNKSRPLRLDTLTR